MGLSRLENFLKSVRGTILYVNPNDLDSTDSIENQGNSLTRPFKTIQRALIEAARFSYQRGLDNDRFGQTTILVYPGDHTIDNRPGWIPDGQNNFKLRSGESSDNLVPFDLSTNFDLSTSDNALYKLNSIHGGVIIPRGTSLVGLDLRKTKIRPKYVPSPTNDNIEPSCIFRVTGGCYLWQFSMFDSDPNGQCYIDYTENRFVPNFSHHKLRCFEYADGTNNVIINDNFLSYESDRTDLDMYYEKIGIVYGQSSGRPVEPDYPSFTLDIHPKVDEYRIVGSTGLSVGISSIKSGDGIVPSKVVTVTLSEPVSGLDVDTPFRVEGISAEGYNGQYVVTEKISDTEITYQVQNTPLVALPSAVGSVLSLTSDTVTSASPYIFNVSSRSVYGMCGLLADGNKASGFKSMVVAQFTGIGLQKDDNAFVIYNEFTGTYDDNTLPGNETISSNSRAIFKPAYRNFHIKAINDAFIQNVSIFAIGYAEHFSVESGGDLSVTNSNSNFGSKSLVASGFRKNAYRQDDLGYITHIIPPKEFSNEEYSIEFNSIDVETTVSVGNSERLYLYNQSNQNVLPDYVLEGYRIGAKKNDTVNVLISNQGSTEEYKSLIVMQNSQTSSEKSFRVKRNSIGINSIGNLSLGGDLNTITLAEPHTFENGESVRIISENGHLPDGLSPNTLYYVITDSNDNSGITTNVNIKLSKTLNDANSANEIFINNKGGILDVVSRVSDKVPGEIGHPIQYDDSVNQWYIKVSNSSSENEIYPIIVGLGTEILGESTPRTFINRKRYDRNSNDSIYKVRYVIPAQTDGVYARPPSDGFIIQESNTSIGSSIGEIQTYYGSGSLVNANQQRNFRFIAGATWNGTEAIFDTELPHHISVGSEVEIFNVKSSLNITAKQNYGFNRTFLVNEVPNSKQFVVGLTTDPGVFSSDTSTRDISLPYFKRKKYSNTNYIYRNQEFQKYIPGKQDGIYYLTLVNATNSPSVSPFTEENYSQPVRDLYPQIDRDNPVSDPEESKSFASPSLIGEVIVNDVRKSVTKEAISRSLVDSNIGIAVTDIYSDNETTHRIFTDIDHGLNRITKVSLLSGGSGYSSSGVFYNAKLVPGSTTGQYATAKVTINPSGSITDVVIMDGGSAYGIGNTLSITGLPTNPGHVPAVVTVTQIYNNVDDSFGLSGISSYSQYNDIYRIKEVDSPTSFIAYSSNNIDNYSPTRIGLTYTERSFCYLTGKAVVIQEINYDNLSGIATVTSLGSHPFYVGNKIKIGGASENLYNGEFTVTQNVGLTTFVVNVGVSTNIPNVSGNIYAYDMGITSKGGVISVDYENISGRMISNYAGISTTLLYEISDKTIDEITISGIDKLDINIGDYLQVGDELMRVKTTVPQSIGPTDPIYVFRGVLGTKSNFHPVNSPIKRVRVNPIEFRRHSIIRASAHTFEYVGFGPGNYSTAFPDKQDRQISPQEELLAQSTRKDGGINFYTGMNDKGISYSGNKKLSTVTGQEEIFDTPVQTIVGEDISNLPGINVTSALEGEFTRSIKVNGGVDRKALSQFDGPVVFNEKITSTSNKGIEANSLFLQGNSKVSRKYSVTETDPTVAGNPGDIQYNANPSNGDYLGWVYTRNNEWQRFGKIGLLASGNVIGIAKDSSYVGLATQIDFIGPGIDTSYYNAVAGIATVVVGSSVGLSTGGNFVGIPTLLNFVGENISISADYDSSTGISTINIVGLGTTSVYEGSSFVKVGAVGSNFLKADGSDSSLSFSEVTDALGYVPANSSSVTGDFPQGNSTVLDSFELASNGGPFDGVKTDFQMKINGNSFIPSGNSANIIISIGGVIQKPGTDYIVVQNSGQNTNIIRFTTPPSAGKSHFAVALGGQGSLTSNIAWISKGDLLVGTGNNTASVVSVGNNGYSLIADSTSASGVSWKPSFDSLIGKGSDNQIIVADNSVGIGVTWKHQYYTTSTSISKVLVNREYCSVTADSIALNLPASPTNGSYVSINNTGTFTNIIVGRNGSLLMGLAEDMIIDIPYVTITLVYVNNSIGWRML